MVVAQQLILLNQRGGSRSRRGGYVGRQGSRAPHPTDRVTCMKTQPRHWLCVCVCVCVHSAGLCAATLHLSGCEPTYLFGSFIVWAVGSLINHQALWEVHWRVDPGFSVWTYRLSVYRQSYWQLLWLSDSWRVLPSGSSLHTFRALPKPRAVDTNCKTLMNAKAVGCTVADV